MVDRFLELRQIQQMRKLTRSEQQEYDTLAKIKQEAANHPAVQAARAEAARQQAEREQRAAAANTERAFQTIFSTVVGKPPMVCLDNQANRAELLSWLHPNEHVTDPRTWFLRVLQETPSLKTKLAWTPYLTPAQKVLQQKDDQKRLQEQFDLACKTYGLAPLQSNFQVWSQVPDPVISVFNGQPCIVLEDGTTLDLIAASQEMKDQWAEDARQKSFQAKQDRLREMRDSNDLAGLRAEAAREHAERNSPQTVATVQQQRIYKELQIQYERDTQAGFTTPLPAVFTKQKIYTWNADEMRRQMRRYGASRITARIHGLTSIPDGNGGTISFE